MLPIPKPNKKLRTKINLDATAAHSVRTDRDSRLAVTDFHGLTDTDMSEEMTSLSPGAQGCAATGRLPSRN